MLLIFLIGAMLTQAQPELPAESKAQQFEYIAGPEVWRWRCTTGVGNVPARPPRQETRGH